MYAGGCEGEQERKTRMQGYKAGKGTGIQGYSSAFARHRVE